MAGCTCFPPEVELGSCTGPQVPCFRHSEWQRALTVPVHQPELGPRKPTSSGGERDKNLLCPLQTRLNFPAPGMVVVSRQAYIYRHRVNIRDKIEDKNIFILIALGFDLYRQALEKPIQFDRKQTTLWAVGDPERTQTYFPGRPLLPEPSGSLCFSSERELCPSTREDEAGRPPVWGHTRYMRARGELGEKRKFEIKL